MQVRYCGGQLQRPAKTDSTTGVLDCVFTRSGVFCSKGPGLGAGTPRCDSTLIHASCQAPFPDRTEGVAHRLSKLSCEVPLGGWGTGEGVRGDRRSVQVFVGYSFQIPVSISRSRVAER